MKWGITEMWIVVKEGSEGGKKRPRGGDEAMGLMCITMYL